ncbi:uncharacterized protein LJ206_002251 isoform 2-T2 [Theristicus caerulescens]
MLLAPAPSAGPSPSCRRPHPGAEAATPSAAVDGIAAQAPTMSCIHYKFFSKLDYDIVTFKGLHIALRDLKRQIMAREKLKAANCDLQISNAQSKEGKMLRKCGRISPNNKLARIL